MYRLTWILMLLLGCSQNQLIKEPITTASSARSGDIAGDSGFFTVFAWSLRSTDGRSVDNFRQIDPSDRTRLEDHGFAQPQMDSDTFRRQLKTHALWMLREGSTTRQAHSQHGQAKLRDGRYLSRESNVIRSVTMKRSSRLTQCAEMRKVFSEKRITDGWMSEDVAQSWQRIGLSEEAPVMSFDYQVATKGFLLIDLEAQLSRLYVYQELDGHPASELVEIIVSCGF
ncbi:MAG: hypothetical protein ACPGQS_13595 [Bradymonadia bacterium]